MCEKRHHKKDFCDSEMSCHVNL